MSNNKQSSVEWLIGQLKISTYWNTLIAELEFMDLEIDDIIEKAKAMHKKEIIEAYKWGRYDSDKLVMSERFYREQYYEQTFGGSK